MISAQVMAKAEQMGPSVPQIQQKDPGMEHGTAPMAMHLGSLVFQKHATLKEAHERKCGSVSVSGSDGSTCSETRCAPEETSHSKRPCEVVTDDKVLKKQKIGNAFTKKRSNGGIQGSRRGKKQCNFSAEQVAVLKQWFAENYDDPYPAPHVKELLCSKTGLSWKQVSDWFQNARCRAWSNKRGIAFSSAPLAVRSIAANRASITDSTTPGKAVAATCGITSNLEVPNRVNVPQPSPKTYNQQSWGASLNLRSVQQHEQYAQLQRDGSRTNIVYSFKQQSSPEETKIGTPVSAQQSHLQSMRSLQPALQMQLQVQMQPLQASQSRAAVTYHNHAALMSTQGQIVNSIAGAHALALHQPRMVVRDRMNSGIHHPTRSAMQPQSAIVVDAAFNNPGSQPNSNGRVVRRRARLPRKARELLKKWFNEHLRYPYPTSNEKEMLQKQTGLTARQIFNWFTNRRKRDPNWCPNKNVPRVGKRVETKCDSVPAPSVPHVENRSNPRKNDIDTEAELLLALAG